MCRTRIGPQEVGPFTHRQVSPRSPGSVDEDAKLATAAAVGNRRQRVTAGYTAPINVDGEQMRIVVTGAAGFIGSHIVDQLHAAGHEVIAVDSLDPSAHRSAPRWLDETVEWQWRDVREPELWRDILPGVDAVCHQAAKVGLGVDFGDAPEYVANNDLGTARMLAGMFEAGFSGRIVLASSMVVYGEGRYRCETHGDVRPGARTIADLDARRFEPCCPICGSELSPALVGEDAPIDPRNVYAATKIHQEHLANAWAHARVDPP